MMQPELSSQLSWQCFNNVGSFLGENDVHGFALDMDVDMTCFDLSPPFMRTDDSIDIFCVSPPPPHSPDEFMDFSVDDLQVALQDDDIFPTSLDEFEPVLSSEVEDLWECLEESGGSFSNYTSRDTTSVQPLYFPTEDVEIDNQVLVKAYGEAMEMEQTELADVIKKRISEKVSLVDETRDRLLYYAFQPSSYQETDYLKQECVKNLNAGFKLVYQKFPHGRIAHFRANAAILEAMPHDAEIICVIDFDMGDGVQWSMVIDAIGRQQMALQQQQQQQQCPLFKQKVLRLTSIKRSEETWRFEDTKSRLSDHARAFGLKLKVEEMELQDLVSEIKNSNDRRKEWLVFNCMVGLPHMGRVRSRSHVLEFLKMAQNMLHNSDSCKSSKSGILTFGEGDAWKKLENCSGFGSFFDGYISHYHALLESMEWNFPLNLVEARITLESLFVAPYVSNIVLSQKWEEMKKKKDCDIEKGEVVVMKGWGVSEESLMEAREMVKRESGESMHRVRIEGENKNEMVLDWRGTPLVRVSTWI